jgi:hypothetical protein
MGPDSKQIKSPKGFSRMVKKYGPGYVALSQNSGRVLASGKDIKEVWKKIKKSPLFKENKVVIRHVPPPKSSLVYGQI